MKICPFCAEEIQDAAIKCRHCGEFLDGSVRPGPPALPQAVPWYFKGGFLVFMACTVGPFMLPLVWWHPKMKPVTKIVISVIVIGIYAWLTVATIGAFRRAMELMPEFQQLFKEFGVY